MEEYQEQGSPPTPSSSEVDTILISEATEYLTGDGGDSGSPQVRSRRPSCVSTGFELEKDVDDDDLIDQFEKETRGRDEVDGVGPETTAVTPKAVTPTSSPRAPSPKPGPSREVHGQNNGLPRYFEGEAQARRNCYGGPEVLRSVSSPNKRVVKWVSEVTPQLPPEDDQLSSSTDQNQNSDSSSRWQAQFPNIREMIRLCKDRLSTWTSDAIPAMDIILEHEHAQLAQIMSLLQENLVPEALMHIIQFIWSPDPRQDCPEILRAQGVMVEILKCAVPAPTKDQEFDLQPSYEMRPSVEKLIMESEVFMDNSAYFAPFRLDLLKTRVLKANKIEGILEEVLHYFNTCVNLSLEWKKSVLNVDLDNIRIIISDANKAKEFLNAENQGKLAKQIHDWFREIMFYRAHTLLKAKGFDFLVSQPESATETDENLYDPSIPRTGTHENNHIEVGRFAPGTAQCMPNVSQDGTEPASPENEPPLGLLPGDRDSPHLGPNLPNQEDLQDVDINEYLNQFHPDNLQAFFLQHPDFGRDLFEDEVEESSGGQSQPWSLESNIRNGSLPRMSRSNSASPPIGLDISSTWLDLGEPGPKRSRPSPSLE